MLAGINLAELHRDDVGAGGGLHRVGDRQIVGQVTVDEVGIIILQTGHGNKVLVATQQLVVDAGTVPVADNLTLVRL